MVLAFVIYFDVLGKKESARVEKAKKHIKKRISSARFYHLIGAGFVISLITLIDDFIVLIPLFINTIPNQIGAVIGIYVSIFIQLILMVYFAEKLTKLTNLKEIASGGLVILAILVFFQVF